MAEELWQLLGHGKTLAYEPWPQFDPALTIDESVEIPVQINGKLRSKLVVPREISSQQLEELARAEARIAELLAGKQIVKTVVVPGRMVNFVIK
jgi:leucyl-tRNA synthetase